MYAVVRLPLDHRNGLLMDAHIRYTNPAPTHAYTTGMDSQVTISTSDGGGHKTGSGSSHGSPMIVKKASRHMKPVRGIHIINDTASLQL
jgi:hypothetical protein